RSEDIPGQGRGGVPDGACGRANIRVDVPRRQLQPVECAVGCTRGRARGHEAGGGGQVNAPPLAPMDYIGPAVPAGGFVLLMSTVREPARRTFNAVLVAGTAGVYLSGGFGLWELMYPAIVTPILYLGLRSYRFIGIAWLMHAAWDLPHHFWGHPIWPFM